MLCEGDCDDDDPTVRPWSPELCDDAIDNDCDGAVDFDDADCLPAGCACDAARPGHGAPFALLLVPAFARRRLR